MTARQLLTVSFCALSFFGICAQVSTTPLTLEECRSMAVKNNKQLAVSREKIRQASYQKKEAFAAYLPAVDLTGAYAYNQKNISLFKEDQHLPVQSFNPQTGKYEFDLLKNPETGLPVTAPDGTPVPAQVAYLPKSALTYDVHNIFFGAVTLTQPVFMGGKIVAMNRLTHYAEELARAMADNSAQDVIYAVDAAYWTVVSLDAKKELADSYVNLLDSLDRNVAAMLAQGVATKADKLSVDVKLNQARIDQTKVDNGLVLAKMALAQLCGLPVDGSYVMADNLAGGQQELGLEAPAPPADMAEVYNSRDDLRALELGVRIAEQQSKVARASMLPEIALIGSYTVTNPNSYNGYETRFGGAFSVGVAVKIPLLHWGGNYNKYRAARSARTIMELELADAKEKVELQVQQAIFRQREALKTLETTIENQKSADENLRCAKAGFIEGVLTADDVMAAQTAWLQAGSERIDAQIDVRLCDVYLSKVLGTMKY